MRRISALLALVTLSAHAAAPSPYAPLASFVGHCWQGQLPGARKDIDTHCFTHVYGDNFVRDVHTVHGDAHKDYMGETTYFQDAATKTLRYLYIENDGGASMSSVEAHDGELVFPETTHSDGGKSQTYRSHWKMSGSDAYDAVMEFKKDGVWTTAWIVNMHKLPDAPAK